MRRTTATATLKLASRCAFAADVRLQNILLETTRTGDSLETIHLLE